MYMYIVSYSYMCAYNINVHVHVHKMDVQIYIYCALLLHFKVYMHLKVLCRPIRITNIYTKSWYTVYRVLPLAPVHVCMYMYMYTWSQ